MVSTAMLPVIFAMFVVATTSLRKKSPSPKPLNP